MGDLVLLMGPTGAGKSVQGDLLAERLAGVHLSSGKLLRRDPRAAALLESGQLAPADEVHRVVGEALVAVPSDRPVVLDGTPRTQQDVVWLEANMDRFERRLVAVIWIDIDVATSLHRLELRGRSDDGDAAVREKWELFRSVTEPVIEHYEQLGQLRHVDGRGSIEEVHQLVMAACAKAGLV